MRIRIDQLNQIAIDRFVSTSGKYCVFLAEAYKPVTGIAGSATLRWYEFVACNDSGRVLKKVSLGGDRKEAMEEWERLKGILTAPFKGQEEQNDEWRVMTYANHKFTEGESEAMKINPIGARVFLREIIAVDEGTKRWEQAGLALIQDEAKMPKPTMGIVIKVGNDPMMAEMCAPGDCVMFSKHAGSTFLENGQQYRSIELHEIIGVRRQEDGLEDLGLRDKESVQ